MDLAKLLDLIQSSSLYFPRADHLGDPFEGSITKATQQNRQLVTDMFVRHGTPNAYKLPWTFSEALIQARTQNYVSCWHMNSVESAAMWAQYATHSTSIAIQSSFARLVNSLQHATADVYIGTVQYTDYDKDFISEDNQFVPLLHKRLSYSYENELRAVVWLTQKQSELLGVNPSEKPNGIKVAVDLTKFVSIIYVSPLAPQWFAEVVKKLVDDYKVHSAVQYSRLGEEAIF